MVVRRLSILEEIVESEKISSGSTYPTNLLKTLNGKARCFLAPPLKDVPPNPVFEARVQFFSNQTRDSSISSIYGKSYNIFGDTCLKEDGHPPELYESIKHHGLTNPFKYHGSSKDSATRTLHQVSKLPLMVSGTINGLYIKVYSPIIQAQKLMFTIHPDPPIPDPKEMAVWASKHRRTIKAVFDEIYSGDIGLDLIYHPGDKYLNPHLHGVLYCGTSTPIRKIESDTFKTYFCHHCSKRHRFSSPNGKKHFDLMQYYSDLKLFQSKPKGYEISSFPPPSLQELREISKEAHRRMGSPPSKLPYVKTKTISLITDLDELKKHLAYCRRHPIVKVYENDLKKDQSDPTAIIMGDISDSDDDPFDVRTCIENHKTNVLCHNASDLLEEDIAGEPILQEPISLEPEFDNPFFRYLFETVVFSGKLRLKNYFQSVPYGFLRYLKHILPQDPSPKKKCRVCKACGDSDPPTFNNFSRYKKKEIQFLIGEANLIFCRISDDGSSYSEEDPPDWLHTYE